MPNAVPGFVYTDHVKPAVAITNPAAGGTTSGTINVTATATDNDQIAGVQFYLDGAPLGAEDTVAPYSVSLNTAALTTGAHSVYAIARDRVGNTTQAATVNFTNADQHAPTVAITSPGNGATVSGTITLTATASDDVGVTHVDYYVDGGYVGSGSGGSWSLGLNTQAYGDGGHTIQAYAYDAAGNQSPVSTISVTMSNNPAFLGGGAGNGGASFPPVPAGTLIVVTAFAQSSLAITDNAGSTYNLLGSAPVSETNPYYHTGTAYYYYAYANAGASAVAANGFGDQTTVAVATYSHAEGGIYSNSGIGNWGRWSGTPFSFGTTRGLAVVFLWAGYDGFAGGPASIAGPFTKREAATDHDLTDFEVSVSDWITASGGSGTPSGGNASASDVYGAVVVFENS